MSPIEQVNQLIITSNDGRSKKYWKKFLVGISVLSKYEGEFYLAQKLRNKLFGKMTFEPDKNGNKTKGHIIFDEMYTRTHKGNNQDGNGCSRYRRNPS